MLGMDSFVELADRLWGFLRRPKVERPSLLMDDAHRKDSARPVRPASLRQSEVHSSRPSVLRNEAPELARHGDEGALSRASAKGQCPRRSEADRGEGARDSQAMEARQWQGAGRGVRRQRQPDKPSRAAQGMDTHLASEIAIKIAAKRLAQEVLPRVA